MLRTNLDSLKGSEPSLHSEVLNYNTIIIIIKFQWITILYLIQETLPCSKIIKIYFWAFQALSFYIEVSNPSGFDFVCGNGCRHYLLPSPSLLVEIFKIRALDNILGVGYWEGIARNKHEEYRVREKERHTNKSLLWTTGLGHWYWHVNRVSSRAMYHTMYPLPSENQP